MFCVWVSVYSRRQAMIGMKMGVLVVVVVMLGRSRYDSGAFSVIVAGGGVI